MRTIGLFAGLVIVCSKVVADFSDFVDHFDRLDYDTKSIHSAHLRAKRSTDSGRSSYLDIDFHALNRDFKLRLKPSTSSFAPDVEEVLPDGSVVNPDLSFIYHGHLLGEPTSKVRGSIIGGVFSGRISTAEGIYHVEKSQVYYAEKQNFHSVIYNEKDMGEKSQRLRRNIENGQLSFCPMEDARVRKWMREVQRSAVYEPSENNVSARASHTVREESNTRHMYSFNNDHQSHSIKLTKRQMAKTPTTCNLYLQSDPRLWDYFTSLGYAASDVKQEIISLFESHMLNAADIFIGTRFQYGSSPIYGGITFSIRRILVNASDAACPQGTSTPFGANPFCTPNLDASNFLNLVSMQNYDDFCASFVFTYRDFDGGVLGLAWVGSNVAGNAGGICERYKKFRNPDGSATYKSLNTGIVTLMNYGQRILPPVSSLTFTHEIGHSFGSPHDFPLPCTPFLQSPPDPKGNYIMFASATNADRVNNNLFSKCSVENMTVVLDAIMENRNGKSNCFTYGGAAFCGNGLTETGEECDCGFLQDCAESCCYGRAEQNTDCKLKPGKICSPSQGQCCLNDCTFLPAATNKTCTPSDECKGLAKCDGSQAVCPLGAPQPNFTACSFDTKVCIGGVCQGSICNKIGWRQCYLTTTSTAKSDLENLCYLACQPEGSSVCVSTLDNQALNMAENQPLRDMLAAIGKQSIKLQTGDPCNNFKGYCDTRQVCRNIDASGPLARLTQMLFSGQVITSVKEWIQMYWWAVILIIIAIIVTMGLFIKVCAVHTPSSNPRQAPARRYTLRRSGQRERPMSIASGPSQGLSVVSTSKV